MHAQLLKNGQISISNTQQRKDAIQTIHNLKINEFYKIVRCSNSWSQRVNDDRDIMFVNAPMESKVYKEFIKIVDKRKEVQERFIEINGNLYTIDKGEQPKDSGDVITYKSNVEGTSKLIYIKGRKDIVLVDRGKFDDSNKPNAVCIPNDIRNAFIEDSLNCGGKRERVYEIRKVKNPKLYEKWKNLIKCIYDEGVKK